MPKLELLTIAVGYISQLGHEGKGDSEFGGPFGIHVSSNGRTYVADDLNHMIQIFDRKGRFLSRIGKHGKARGSLLILIA